MEQMEQKDLGVGGNTKPQPKCRKYCFTLNNYTVEEEKKLVEQFSKDLYVIGHEVGENKTPHLQGYVEFKNPRSFESIKKIMPRAHIEKARGTTKQNFMYCSKEGKYLTNITDIKLPKKVRDPMDGKEPYDWQQQIIAIVNQEPHDRTIYWYWENEGNRGKSAICKHLCLKYKALVLNGKQNDMFNAILQWKENTGDFPETIIIDIPRSTIDYVSWGAIEKIKDGLFYSGKYEGGMVIMNPPHIICMANTEPAMEKLSADRWVITNI